MKPQLNSVPKILRLLTWALLITILAIVALARARLLALPLERDEGEYAYTGQLLLQGIAPYKLAYSMKFPGTSAVYALLMAIFGQTASGIHLGLIFINLITAGVILLLGRRLMGEAGGLASAAAFGVLSLMPYVLGQAAHATHFVLLPAMVGCLVVLDAADRQSNFRILVAGTFFGLAAIMKQPGLFFVFFGGVYLFSRDLWEGASFRRALFRTLMLVSGAALPVCMMGLTLWKLGVFEKFWFWTIKYTQQYATEVSIGVGFRVLVDLLPQVIGRAWPIWAIAAGGLICSLFNDFRRTRGFLITLTLFSGLAVCAGLYFRPHYFILFLPAVSLLAGNAVAITLRALGDRAAHLRFAVILLLGLALAWPICAEADFFFRRSISEASQMVNGTDPFPESVKIAEYIRERSTPSDTIAVLGSEPEIYFYSQRHSATGYIYTYGLMEPQPFANRMQQEMMHEIESARPKFLVLVVMNRSWLAGRDSDKSIFSWADMYCDANYDEAALINISETGTDYYFADAARTAKPVGDHILVYQQKSEL